MNGEKLLMCLICLNLGAAICRVATGIDWNCEKQFMWPIMTFILTGAALFFYIIATFDDEYKK